MSVEKPPRVPRVPGRPEGPSHPGSPPDLGGPRSRPAVKVDETARAWAQLAEARSKYHDGALPAAVQAAGSLLDTLRSAVRRGQDEERYALVGAAATVLGLALTGQDLRDRAGEAWRKAVDAFARAPRWTGFRSDVAADWGMALAAVGRTEDAVPALRSAIDLGETTPVVRRTLADALAATGRAEEAIDVLADAVTRTPLDWEANLRLAQLLDDTDRPADVKEKAWSDAAEVLLLERRHDLAATAAERAVDHQVTAGTLDLLGRAYTAAGRYDEAIALLREADAWEPSVAVRLDLATVLTANGEPDAAADAARLALDLKPGEPAALSAAAGHLIAVRRLEEADEAIDGLAAVDRSLADAYRGVVAYHGGDDETALALLTGSGYDQTDDTALLWLVAEALLGLREPEASLAALDRVIALNPYDGDALAQRGVIKLELQRVEEAEQDLVAALDHTSHPGVHAYLGELLGQTDRHEEAVEHLARAIDEGYGEVWVWSAYAHSLVEQNRLADAEHAYRQALVLDPDHLGSLHRLASILLDKFTEEADAEVDRLLRHALEIDSSSASATAMLGELSRRQGRLDEAVGLFEQSVRLEDEWPWGLGTFAQTLRSRYQAGGAPEDLSRARTLIDRALTVADMEPFLYAELAEVLMLQGRGKDAHRALRTAIGLDPDEPGYVVRRGDFCLDAGDARRARRYYEQALEADPTQPGLRTRLAEALGQLGERRAAMALLEEALAADPDDEDARYQRFILLWNAERLSDAVVDLEPLATSARYGVEIAAWRGEAYRLQGRYDEAVRVLDDVLAENPGHAVALASRGAVQLARGRTDEARRDLEQAVRVDPSDPYAQSRLGELLAVTGRAEEAADRLGAQLKEKPDPGLLPIQATQLTRCGRQAEAVLQLEQGLWERPDDGQLFSALGWALVASERYDEAIGYLRQAVDRQPDQLGPLLDLVNAQLNVGPADALATARRAVKKRPAEPGGWAACSRVQMATGDYTAAADSARTATQCWHQTMDAYTALGWALHHTWAAGTDAPGEEVQEALRAYRRARELDALDPWAVAGEANVLFSLGETDGSRRCYEESLELIGTRREFDSYLPALHAWCLYRLGRYDEAMSPGLRAVSLAQKPASTLFDLVLIAAADGRVAEAQTLLARAAEELRREHPDFRRGTLAVARFDLRQARPALSEEDFASLERRYAQIRT